jgi:hypothetical protein
MNMPTPGSARRPVLLAAVVAAVAGAAASHGQEAAQKPGLSLTIYSSAQPGAIPPELYRPVAGQPQYARQPIPGYAMIRDVRPMELAKGRSTVRFADVAALIDPTTVSFTALSDQSAAVLEQNYQFDLVSNEKLLEKFIDREVAATVIRGDKPETVRGTLLSSQPGMLVLRHEDGSVEVVSGYVSLQLPSLPQGLITRPTLVWDVASTTGGSQLVRVGYQTSGITWWTDYNLVYDEKTANSGTVDVNAWVSILNQSGAGYPEARLKLIAGDVHRAPQPMQDYRMRSMEMNMAAPAADPGFEEKAFFEYHLYTLGRPATLPDNSTKQIELFPAAHGVPVDKVLVYDGLGENFWYGGNAPMAEASYGVQSKKEVNIYLRFKNDKESGMGMPLPSGRIRVSKLDSADGSLEFIGEDVIKHTPRDEEVLVKMGNAFDVVGERIQVSFSPEVGRRTIEEAIEVRVRNHKEEAVDVVIQERLYRWMNWEIVKKTHEFKKLDAQMVHFPVSIEPGGEAVVRYTVRYTW